MLKIPSPIESTMLEIIIAKSRVKPRLILFPIEQVLIKRKRALEWARMPVHGRTHLYLTVIYRLDTHHASIGRRVSDSVCVNARSLVVKERVTWIGGAY